MTSFVYFKIQPMPNDSRTVLNYIEENKVPMSLLLLLVIQFTMIGIDRVLYLRKNMTGKVIFHLFIVLYTHTWMFFILPYYTGRRLKESTLPMIYYIIKCIYMLLSAYQIRCGFPTRVLGNFIMKQYHIVSLIGFKMWVELTGRQRDFSDAISFLQLHVDAILVWIEKRHWLGVHKDVFDVFRMGSSWVDSRSSLSDKMHETSRSRWAARRDQNLCE